MMTRDEAWRIVAEAYAVHFILFACDLSPDDVFVSTDRVVNAPTTDRYASVIARRSGQQFLMWIAPLPTRQDVRAFRKAWRIFSVKQPKMPKAELDLVVCTSDAYRQLPAIRDGLIAKGLATQASGTNVLEAWRATFERTTQGPLS